MSQTAAPTARRRPTARLDPASRPSRPIVLATGRGVKKLTAAEAKMLADELTAAAREWEAAEEKRLAAVLVSCRWCGRSFEPRSRTPARRLRGAAMLYCQAKCQWAHKRFRAG